MVGIIMKDVFHCRCDITIQIYSVTIEKIRAAKEARMAYIKNSPN